VACATAWERLINTNSRSRIKFLTAMPESPFKRSKPVLKSPDNALSFRSLGVTVPSSPPSTVATNDNETVAQLLIEKGADREGRDSTDGSTGPAIEQPSRHASSTINKIIPSAIILFSSIVQALCAVMIGHYDASHPRSSPSTLIRILCWQKSALSDSTCLLGLHLPDFIIDPSEFEFVVAVMIYGLAMLIFYDTRKGDRYQDHFLASGTFLGLLAGLALSIREGTTGPYRGCIPMSITVALLLSVAAHSISGKLISSSKLDARESIRGL